MSRPIVSAPLFVSCLLCAACGSADGGTLDARELPLRSLYVQFCMTPAEPAHAEAWVSPYGAAHAVGADPMVPLTTAPTRGPLGEDAPLGLRLDSRGRVLGVDAATAWQSAPQEPERTIPVSVHASLPVVHGALLPEVVHMITRMHGFELASCGPGAVSVSFDVAEDGRTQRENVESVANPRLASCVAQRVRGWAFPAMAARSHVEMDIELEHVEL